MSVAGRTRARRGLVAGLVASLLMVVAGGPAAGWSTGDRPPARELDGDKTRLMDPRGVTVDKAGNLYVTNWGDRKTGDSVLMWAPGWTEDNTPPTKFIAGPATGVHTPLSVAVDTSGNMYVLNSVGLEGSVTMYAAGWASGNTAPTKTLIGSNTGLKHVQHIAVDAAGNIYVTNYNDAKRASSVLMWATGWASGNTAPTKTLTGSNTQLNYPGGVAVDAAGNMYVTNAAAYQAYDTVTMYAAGWASGNTAPTKTLTGPSTRMFNPTSVTFDTAGTMYVTNYDGRSVTMYAAGWANGDTPPIKWIAGGKTSLKFPYSAAVDAAGTLYVTSMDRGVLVYGVNDQNIDFFGILEDVVLGTKPGFTGAISTSGLPVEFSSLTPQTCSVASDGRPLTYLAVGACTIAADQPGIVNDWNPAPRLTQSFQILPPMPAVPAPQHPTRSLGLPTHIATSGWTRLVRLPVNTNAGQQATVRATCTPLARGGVPSGDTSAACRVTRTASAMRVWVSGQQAVQVRVRIHAPATDDYSRYTRSRTYRVTPGR